VEMIPGLYIFNEKISAIGDFFTAGAQLLTSTGFE